ncbi:MAG: ABC transporter substrate-binding protein [Ignavibacteriaceae bacterium]
MRIFKILFSSVLILLLFVSCNAENPKQLKKVVIGISADLETINPIYSFSVDEGVIDETLFLSMVQFEWNDQKGDLNAKPMLATSWEWAPDSSYVIFNLRDDVFWSDGVKFSADDIVYTFDVYSDSKVQSRFYGSFKNYYTDADNHIDLNKTFEVISPLKIKIKFLPESVPSLLDVVFPIIPKHVYEKIGRGNISTSGVNFNPVSNGVYRLKKWERNQSIVLEADKKSFLYKTGMIDEIIFKVVPDYNSRLTQLQKGEIDFSELIKPIDVKDLQKTDNLKIESVKGREYDYIGLSNIDIKSYTENKIIRKNILFGSSKVRKAFAYAINRNEILSEYLNNFGELAITPVSSIFKQYFDDQLKPVDYDPATAKKLLAEEGWIDSDNDGVIEKNNTEFKFTLYIPSSNPLREFAGTIIKNNLKAVGIEMNLEKLELGAFLDNLYNKKFDAWMASWYIQVPLELKAFWYSDLQNTPLNFAGYQNKDADKIIDELNARITLGEKIKKYKKFQEIIFDDQPVTFLYWTDNIVVYNKKIKNLTVNPFGALQKLWEWRLDN